LRKLYKKKTKEAAKTAAKKSGEKAVSATQKVGRAILRFARKHPIAVLLTIVCFLLVVTVQSCVGGVLTIGGGMTGAATLSTYLSDDTDIFAAEAAYDALEAALHNELDNFERRNPGYHEYHYELDAIGHDPYVLISILSAMHEGAWTIGQVRPILAMLFDLQYTLTVTVTVEIRYYTECYSYTDPITGEVDSGCYDVPYNHYICTVKLKNFNLSHLPIYIMDEETLSRYSIYMSTLGNRPDLFPVHAYPNASYYRDYGRHDIPPEYLEDPVFAAIIAEAEKHLGRPYVWGGFSPATSFDCSGYVSWVLNNSGWNIGRLGASGLYNICTPVSTANARPGDLVSQVTSVSVL